MGDDREADQREIYEITVQGRLDESWSDWLEGLTITCESRPAGVAITTLRGPVADQAALQGILTRIWSLNLTVLSVSRGTARADG